MDTVKKLIVVLTCILVLLSSFTFGSSAVEYDPYTEEPMSYDAEFNQYFTPYKVLEYDPIAPFMLTAPYHSFKPSELPWSDMPSYVQEIISAEPVGLTSDTSYSGDYKIPFLLLFTGGGSIHVVAGYNLAIGTYYRSSGEITTVYIATIRSNARINKNAVCYHAYYQKNAQGEYVISTPWEPVQPVSVGDHMSRYIQLSYNNSTPRDFYAYGANCIGAGKTAVAQPIYSDGSSYPRYCFRNDAIYGFAGDVFVYEPDQWNAYFESFVPPTPEQQQASTSKGILQNLKELPTKIADSIKGFFTSLGDRINGFFTSLKNYLLYFQETKPDHVNPFSNILSRFTVFISTYLSRFQSFSNSMSSSYDNIVDYLESGSEIVSHFVNSLPIIEAFLIFFITLAVVRKVVGR